MNGLYREQHNIAIDLRAYNFINSSITYVIDAPPIELITNCDDVYQKITQHQHHQKMILYL